VGLQVFSIHKIIRDVIPFSFTFEMLCTPYIRKALNSGKYGKYYHLNSNEFYPPPDVDIKLLDIKTDGSKQAKQEK
jgi:hypothetical protein